METIKVVAAIIYNKNRFLIAKRNSGLTKGLWEFPGGKIEKGETEEKALIREIREEFKVNISIDSFFLRTMHTHEDFLIELISYLASTPEEIVKSIDHSETAWVLPEEFKNYNFSEPDIPIIEKLSQEFKGKKI